MSLIEELRRRNVIRVSVAYIVAAWVAAQASELILETFGAPDWVMKALLVALLIGFPVAVFVAWAFELTPQGLKRDEDVDRSQPMTSRSGRKLDYFIIAALVLIAGYFIWEARFAGHDPVAPGANSVSRTSGPATDQPPTSAAPNRQSIAVLPFENRSRLEEDEFFVEGVHDDLLANLSRIGSLKVISRTSVNQYKDTQKTIPQIAAELGVGAIMEGAVQRSGNTVRINVQLIDAQTDEHLWAEIFDRTLTADNLFAIQTEISEEIANALQATLSPQEQVRISDRPTENLDAYTAYLRGMQLMETRNSEKINQAMAQFERAVELDPEFALGWTGIAFAAIFQNAYGSSLYIDVMPIMEAAADKAIELNDQLGEPWLIKSDLFGYRNQFQEQELAFKKAIEFSPGSAIAHLWYSNYLADWPQRYTEAYEVARKAEELDPLSPVIKLNIVGKLNALGRFDEAEQKLEELLLINPDFASAYGAMAGVQLNKGRIDLQVYWLRKAFEVDPGDIDWLSNQAFPLLMLGYEEGYLALQQQMEATFPGHPVNGALDMWLNLYRQNIPGALESAEWFNQQIGAHPSFQSLIGLIYMIAGDNQKAIERFKIGSPRFFDRSQWRAAIEDENSSGCTIAYLMMQTGDEAMGRDLMEASLDYMENELPNYTEHADRFGYPECYTASGQYEKALDIVKIQIEHGHFSDQWWLSDLIPFVKPFYQQPGAQELNAVGQAAIDEQRANLKRLEAGGQP